MKNFNDILPGQYIWFSKEGNVGQYRVVDIDKTHNKLTYHDRQDTTKEIDFDYSKSRNNEFYANPQDAFDDAKKYASINFNIKNPGTKEVSIVYKSPEQISKQNIQQMLLD